MQPQFRFPRSSVILMCVILAGVVLAIHKAKDIVQMKEGLPPRIASSDSMLWVWMFALALVLAMTIAAAVWGLLFALRRTGTHRLDGMRTLHEQQ